MAGFLIDVNLPYYFSAWRGPDYIHVRDLNDEWTDTQVWNHARQEDPTIVTKDTDFSDRILLTPPPPRVIHIRCGNLRMRELHRTIASRWEEICRLSTQYKLVWVFENRIEGID